MAEEQEPSGPSLEPPSFFRRRKKQKPAAARPAEAHTSAPEPVPASEPAPALVTDETTAETPAETAVDDSPTTILDDVAPEPEPTVGRGPKPDAPPPNAGPPLFADEVPAAPASASPPAEPVATSAPAPRQAETTTPPGPRREGPLLPVYWAAALVGLVVGGVMAGLTTASFSLCEAARGTNSCGGPGVLLLIAILLVAVVGGAVGLRLLQVTDPGSTSFLAVGLTCVVALLFLVDALFEWWMLIVIPLVSVVTYLVSAWVTTTFVEPERQVGLADEPEVVDHDVR